MPLGAIAPLAHAGHGFGQLGISLTTVLYGVALALIAVFLTARAVRPQPDGGDPRAVTLVSGQVARLLGGIVGAVLLVVLLTDLGAGVLATGRPLVNPAPWVAFVAFIGLQLASAFVGDAWWPVSPVTTLARLARAGRPRRAAPEWASSDLVAPVLLGLVAWLLVAYHAPFSPRVHGWALLLGTVALVVASTQWGRRWLRRTEPFGALGQIGGAAAPLHVDGAALRLRAPLVGLRDLEPGWRVTGVVLVIGASAIYEALSERGWWLDLLGTTRGWARTGWETMGLVWLALLLGVAFEATARVAARLADGRERSQQDDARSEADDDAGDESGPASIRDDAAAMVPLALGYSIANWFAYLVTEAGQGLVRLASDPFDLGWDLFGTAVRPVDYDLFSAGTLAWIEVAFVTLGGVGSLVAAHDLLIRRHAVRPARRAEWAYLVTVGTLTLAGIWSLLGE